MKPIQAAGVPLWLVARNGTTIQVFRKAKSVSVGITRKP
jgi:hypothetical protein